MMSVAHPGSNVMMVISGVPKICWLDGLSFPSDLLNCPEHDLIGLLEALLIVCARDG